MARGDSGYGEVVRVGEAPPDADVLVICEHASNRVPAHLAGLGLAPELLESHIAWDPGALNMAEHMSEVFAAPLVSGRISRLVYDCNRPPEAEAAIPARSEIHDVPGNSGLSEDARGERVAHVYAPFRDALAAEIARRRKALSLMVTVHSFTPVFKGEARGVEIGILHGVDDRFATAMMASRPRAGGFDIRINEPYGPEHGVAHTLDTHGAPNNLMNVMIEVRNDLIANTAAQRDMALLLSDWIRSTMEQLGTGDAA